MRTNERSGSERWRQLQQALVLAVAVSAWPVYAEAQYSLDELAAFEAALGQLIQQQQIPGLAAAIVRDGEVVWSRGYGFSHEAVPVTPDTPFWIASLTKPILGLLFLQLEAEGLVDLSDRVNDVPGWADLCGWLSASPLPFGRDLRCSAPITIENILHHAVNGEPGTGFLYNPVMYSRLSRYIEHKSGGKVEDVEGRHNRMAQLVEERILAPAGMVRTMSSMWQRERADVYFDLADGFGLDGSGEWIQRPRPERQLTGGAGIVSTVLDLARLDIAMDRGVLAAPEIMARLFTPHVTAAGSVLPYGFGWYVQEHNGERVQWHGGWDEEAGFSALYLRLPQRRATLILLANGEGLHWGNPLDQAAVEESPFARLFFDLGRGGLN